MQGGRGGGREEERAGAGRESDLQRRERLSVFRPESAPTVLAQPGTVLDMSPEGSLSGPPPPRSQPPQDLSTSEQMGEYYTKFWIAIFNVATSHCVRDVPLFKINQQFYGST